MTCEHPYCGPVCVFADEPVARSTPPAARLGYLRAELARRSFADFARQLWPVIEPTRALLPSVAFDAICAVLQEAGERGGDWAISCPPGVSKSLLASVAFPAWLLLRTGGQKRILSAAYSHDFAVRDARRCRDLIQSKEYQALVAGKWSLRQDSNRADDYWCTAGGRRLVSSVSGRTTGERVDILVLDDLLNATDVHSEATRKEAVRYLTEVLPSRLDDKANATRVLIGQRLHPFDPLSVAVEQGWQHLVLPALATDEPCELRRDDGSLIWRDPRQPGEPLFELLGPDVLAKLREEMGSAAFLAQYMQVPASDETAMIKRGWFRFYRPASAPSGGKRPSGCYDGPAAELPQAFDKVVIAADLSFGSAKGDFCSVQAWGAKGSARYLLEQWHKRAGFEEQCAAIKEMSTRYPFAKICVERAANGAAVIETLTKAMPGVVPILPQGPKEARVGAVLPQLEAGNVFVPEGVPWIDSYIEELVGFGSHAAHDDRTDAMAYALIELRTSNAARWIAMCGDSDAPKFDPMKVAAPPSTTLSVADAITAAIASHRVAAERAAAAEQVRLEARAKRVAAWEAEHGQPFFGAFPDELDEWAQLGYEAKLHQRARSRGLR